VTEPKHTPGKSASQTPSGPAAEPAAGGPSPAARQAAELSAAFEDQIRRALDFELPPDSSALALVDHHLASLRDEDREPIIRLLAAQAGAWFGEFVRRELGATWIGDRDEPRRLRLLLEPQLIHFSPVDMAYEAIFSGPAQDGDPRLPAGAELDAAFHLRKRAPSTADEHEPELSEHEWVMDRLAEVPPVPEDQYYSLTGRFETLQLILELLANRQLARGQAPTRYHLNDYVEELAGE
jgi:hypothetical protein